MNVQKNQTASNIFVKNEITVLKNRIRNKYQGFQVPFSERRALLLSGDTLLILLAIWGAFLLWQQAAQSSGYVFNAVSIWIRWYWFPILLGGWWVLAWLNDLYDIPSSIHITTSAVRVAVVGALGLTIYLVVFFLAPHMPRRFFLYFLLLALPTIILWRWTYAMLFSIMPFRHRILIIGQGKRARSIISALKQSPKLNYEVLGYITDGPITSEAAHDDLPIWGHTGELSSLVKQLQIHEVVIAIEQRLGKNLFQQLIECQADGVQVSLMPELYEKLYRKVPIEHIDPSWALQVMQGPVFSRLQLSYKRLMDLVLAAVGLLIFLPCIFLIALAIRLDSPGPIFYRQVRCGRAGKPFTILKFRTMIPDAEQKGQAHWAIRGDPRVTRVGRFLRKTRLDELPQLLNILRGEMSVVGPRPERPEFVEMLQQEIPFYRTRLMIKPGLTGWAQTCYDYGNSVEDALIKLQYDFFYLRYWSLWFDLYIIFRTFVVVLKFKGT